MSGRVGEPNTVEAAALLPLPDMARMSDAQVRGAACAWCAVVLAPATAVDLGLRRIRLLDRHIRGLGRRRHRRPPPRKRQPRQTYPSASRTPVTGTRRSRR